MFRRYNRRHSRFDQPDPYDGSYSLTDLQSFNRYAYTQNDPVNFVDPTGLFIDPFFQIGPPPSWVDVPIPNDNALLGGGIGGHRHDLADDIDPQKPYPCRTFRSVMTRRAIALQ